MKQKNGKYLHTLDKTIKVWNVLSNNGIQPIKTISQHRDIVYKVITLTGNRFASCSDEDGTVKLYNSETYKQIEIPFEQQQYPCSLLQLKDKVKYLLFVLVLLLFIFINYLTLINY